jgi:DNA polymerase III subunit alpha
MSYINLRTYSDYTLHLGVSKIKKNAEKAEALKHIGFSTTDKMSLAGIVESLRIKKSNPKMGMVFGVEINLTKSKNSQNMANPYSFAMVFIKNYKGYQNLCRMIAESSTDAYFYYKPRIDLALLEKYSEGLILTTGTHDSVVGFEYLNDTGKDEEMFLHLKNVFKDDFYGEICIFNGSKTWSKENKMFITTEDKQKKYNMRIIELCEKHGVKTYLSHPSYMVEEKLHFIQNCMIFNSPGNNGWHIPEPLVLKDEEQIINSCKNLSYDFTKTDVHNLMSVSTEIMRKCTSFDVPFELHLPDINHDNNHLVNNPEAVKKLDAFIGFCKIHDQPFSDLFDVCSSEKDFRTMMLSVVHNGKIDLFKNTEARDRLLKELIVTQRNGIHRFADYFNPLENVTNFIREQGEYRGFSRGSGGGSILNYAMDITDLNPITFDLIYERFNSRARVGEFFFEVDES